MVVTDKQMVSTIWLLVLVKNDNCFLAVALGKYMIRIH